MTPGPATRMRRHALVAVKDLAHAKSRLGDGFTLTHRRELVLAMLRDTVATALEVPAIGSVTVVSPDPAVLATARDAGAATLAEPAARHRLNAALDDAAAFVRARFGAVDLVALQADLPALTPSELAEAIDRGRSLPRAIVADHRGSGTTALLVSGGALEPAFGSDSARRHVRSGAVALTGDWPGLRLDVDTRADLEAAARLGVGPATGAALTRIGWPNMCAR